MINLKDKTVLVFGGSSMIGGATIKSLKARGAKVIAPTRLECDLLHIEDIDSVLYDKINIIVNLVTHSGNGQWNAKYPFDTYCTTGTMIFNLFQCIRDVKFIGDLPNLEKILSIIPSCAYPDGHDILTEDLLLKGESHPQVAPHGHVRRASFELSRYLHRQCGITAVCAVVNNAYGPQKVDLEKTKFVESLIKKIYDAKVNNSESITLWGTGTPLRELIYSDDVGEGLARTLESYDDCELPLNIGNLYEYSIQDVVYYIKRIINYEGNILFNNDASMDGQKRKLLDNKRMYDILKWVPPTRLLEGLEKTIDNYVQNSI